jgi:nucleotide sugar dehydrogenase
VLFAEAGFKVTGVDIDERKIKMINAGKSPLPDLNMAKKVRKLVSAKRLYATTHIAAGVGDADIIIIAVPTPITDTKEPDLKHIISAATWISATLKKGQLVILESTTYPGTTEEVLQPILERSGLKAGKDFGIAYCPERYNPGDKVHTPDKVARIVAGITDEWGKVALKLYKTIVTGNVVKLVKNIKTAEAAKIIENIQRDLNVALMNELALIFERMNIDVYDVIEAASTKWNFMRFNPGPGVGGHCLPVDPYYLTHKARELGYHPQVILAGRSVNDFMPLHVAKLAIEGLNDCGKPVKGSKIAILGVAYKPDVGDVRESPAYYLIKELKKLGALCRIHDPLVSDDDCNSLFNLKPVDLSKCLQNADCTIIVTDHTELKKNLSLKKLKKLMAKKAVLIDTRNIFNPSEVINAGFIYKGIGRCATSAIPG